MDSLAGPGRSGLNDGLGVVRGKVYILDNGFQAIHEFDPASDTITRTLDMRSRYPGLHLTGLAGASDALVSMNGDHTVQINPATGVVFHDFEPGPHPLLGVAVLNNQIYLGHIHGTTGIGVLNRDGSSSGTLPCRSG